MTLTTFRLTIAAGFTIAVTWFAVADAGAQGSPPLARPAKNDSPGNSAATPRLQDLPLKASLSQSGITWKFKQPAHAGQFINGDWYVVGPVTIENIDPRPPQPARRRY
jgi:hypothetical protein